MSKFCSVCTDKRRDDVDVALASGRGLVATANQFGLSKSAVHRHKQNCLALRVRAAAKIGSAGANAKREAVRLQGIADGSITPTTRDITSLDGLMAHWARLLERLEGAADEAADRSAFSALAALANPLARTLETVGKLQGVYREPQATTERFSITIQLPEAKTPRSPGRREDLGSANPGEPPPALSFMWPLLDQHNKPSN